MPLKATRALIAPDGTIYCPRGTVLPDDDPVAAKYPNAVVGSTENVSAAFRVEEEAFVPAPAPAAEEFPQPHFFTTDAEEEDPDDEGVML